VYIAAEEAGSVSDEDLQNLSPDELQGATFTSIFSTPSCIQLHVHYIFL
jgi:hypothetical protein